MGNREEEGEEEKWEGWTPPWEENTEAVGDAEGEQVKRRAGERQALKVREKERWKKDWEEGTKGRHLKELEPEPAPTWRKRHAGRTKAQSALLIQLRTGKIGFQDFLYKRRVPEVLSRRYSCDTGAIIMRHVLLSYPR